MELTSIDTMTKWVKVLQEVAEEYPGNITLPTVIRALESRIKEIKSKEQ